MVGSHGDMAHTSRLIILPICILLSNYSALMWVEIKGPFHLLKRRKFFLEKEGNFKVKNYMFR